jgi:hypothetical protein
MAAFAADADLQRQPYAEIILAPVRLERLQLLRAMTPIANLQH